VLSGPRAPVGTRIPSSRCGGDDRSRAPRSSPPADRTAYAGGPIAAVRLRARAPLPVPGYLPGPARAVVPWARRYCAATARRCQLDLDDAWDETLTALLRAAVYFRPGAGTFRHYAARTVVRALWRYGARTTHRRPTMPLELATHELPPLPSAEELASAVELARRLVARPRERAGAAAPSPPVGRAVARR